MAHVRGLHETCGLRTLHVVRPDARPGQHATKLARLDHQRALLERQLAVWTEKQQVTKHRLSLLEKQMAEIGRLVRQFGGPRRAVNGRKRMRAIAPGEQPDGDAVAVRRPEMNIEY
jgi:hypothetical protein